MSGFGARNTMRWRSSTNHSKLNLQTCSIVSISSRIIVIPCRKCTSSSGSIWNSSWLIKLLWIEQMTQTRSLTPLLVSENKSKAQLVASILVKAKYHLVAKSCPFRLTPNVWTAKVMALRSIFFSRSSRWPVWVTNQGQFYLRASTIKDPKCLICNLT